MAAEFAWSLYSTTGTGVQRGGCLVELVAEFGPGGDPGQGTVQDACVDGVGKRFMWI